MAKWISRGGFELLAVGKKHPGVFRTRGGALYVRGEATDPRTGKKHEVSKVLELTDLDAALTHLRDRQREIRAGATSLASRRKFGEFAADLYRRKMVLKELRSAKTQEWWGIALEHHLLPAFGAFYLDSLRLADINAWKEKVAEKINAGALSPHTANGWIRILKVIINAAVGELELPRNPAAGVKPFDTSTIRTFTVEEPNALRPEQLPVFLSTMLGLYPQFYAMTLLGFATGLRPSSLRPIRRRGPHADMLWDTGILLVRRSHSMGTEVMDRTKTAKDQEVGLPPELVDVLRWHVSNLRGSREKPDLLFPSRCGGLMARSALDVPFDDVVAAVQKAHADDPVKHPVNIPFAVTPKGMRRTFQDMARWTGVREIVQQAICGHSTGAMTKRYSTVAVEETREGVAKVISIVGLLRKAG